MPGMYGEPGSGRLTHRRGLAAGTALYLALARAATPGMARREHRRFGGGRGWSHESLAYQQRL